MQSRTEIIIILVILHLWIDLTVPSSGALASALLIWQWIAIVESWLNWNSANDHFFNLLVIVSSCLTHRCSHFCELSFLFPDEGAAFHRQLQLLSTLWTLTAQSKFTLIAHRRCGRLVAQLTSQLLHVIQLLHHGFLLLWRRDRIGDALQPLHFISCLFCPFISFFIILFNVLDFNILIWRRYRLEDIVFIFASLAFYQSDLLKWIFLICRVASVLVQGLLLEIVARSFSLNCLATVAGYIDGSSASIGAMCLPSIWCLLVFFSPIHLDHTSRRVKHWMVVSRTSLPPQLSHLRIHFFPLPASTCFIRTSILNIAISILLRYHIGYSITAIILFSYFQLLRHLNRSCFSILQLLYLGTERLRNYLFTLYSFLAQREVSIFR